MYWSEWGSANCIKRAAMDGSQIQILISNSKEARALTLDYDDRQLCWIEAVDVPMINCSDLDGNFKRGVITSELYKPMGLTAYKDTLYWTDWKTGMLLARLFVFTINLK